MKSIAVQSFVCYKEWLLLVRSERLSSLLKTLEVLDSLDTKLQSGILITHNHSILVHLERGDGPHVVHSLLDTLRESKRLVASINDDNHFTGVQNGADTDSQRSLRDLVDIIVEETTVRHDGIVRLQMNPSANGIRESSHGYARREKNQAR